MDKTADFSIQILSKRANEILAAPLHFAPSARSSEWVFSLGGDDSVQLEGDKILTLFFSENNVSAVEKLFKEVICRLVTGKNLLFLQKLTYREVENYIRDENHLPVFLNSEVSITEDIYKNIAISLQVSIVLSVLESKRGLKSPAKSWSDLSLVEKNNEMKLLFSMLNSSFFRPKPMELVLAEKESVSIVMNSFPLEMGVLEELFKRIFLKRNDISSLKVVAVQ